MQESLDFAINLLQSVVNLCMQAPIVYFVGVAIAGAIISLLLKIMKPE